MGGVQGRTCIEVGGGGGKERGEICVQLWGNQGMEGGRERRTLK